MYVKPLTGSLDNLEMSEKLVETANGGNNGEISSNVSPTEQ